MRGGVSTSASRPAKGALAERPPSAQFPWLAKARRAALDAKVELFESIFAEVRKTRNRRIVRRRCRDASIAADRRGFSLDLLYNQYFRYVRKGRQAAALVTRKRAPGAHPELTAMKRIFEYALLHGGMPIETAFRAFKKRQVPFSHTVSFTYATLVRHARRLGILKLLATMRSIDHHREKAEAQHTAEMNSLEAKGDRVLAAFDAVFRAEFKQEQSDE